MHTFSICTISNKPHQYQEMKASFLKAGFDEQRCRYQVFDNSAGNAYDPYATISEVMAEAAEPYVIFCHQDLLLDKGDGFDQLVTRLDHLTRLDAEWAVAGNAGYTDALESVMRITDPGGVHQSGDLPQQVCSLDENFLVIRTASQVRCTPSLRGFHLYATDLCFRASLDLQSCYVIDFHVTHLSGGNAATEDFEQCLDKFRHYWNQSFLICVIVTQCTQFTLSRSRIIRRVLRSGKVFVWLKQHMREYSRAARAKRQVQRKYRLFRDLVPRKAARKLASLLPGQVP